MRSGAFIIKSRSRRSDLYDKNPAVRAAAKALFEQFTQATDIHAVYKARELLFSMVDGTYRWIGNNNEGVFKFDPETSKWKKDSLHG